MNRIYFHFVCLCTFLLITPLFAVAEVHHCGKLWTNRDCGNLLVESSFVEQTYSPEESRVAIIERKTKLLESLEYSVKRAKLQGDLDFNIESVREHCFSQDVSLDSCRLMAARKEQSIREQVEEVLSRKRQERENERVKSGQHITVITNNQFCRDPYCLRRIIRKRRNRVGSSQGIYENKYQGRRIPQMQLKPYPSKTNVIPKVGRR